MAEPQTAAEASQIVVFRLGEEEYGIAIDTVEGIIRRESATPVPYAPPSMEGVINLRGRIVPVVDLGRRFDLEPSETGPQARIVVIQTGGQLVGLAVDAATEVLTVPQDAIEAAPEVVSSQAMRDAITGVARVDDRLIVLLRVEHVIPAVEELYAATEEGS